MKFIITILSFAFASIAFAGTYKCKAQRSGDASPLPPPLWQAEVELTEKIFTRTYILTDSPFETEEFYKKFPTPHKGHEALVSKYKGELMVMISKLSREDGGGISIVQGIVESPRPEMGEVAAWTDDSANVIAVRNKRRSLTIECVRKK